MFLGKPCIRCQVAEEFKLHIYQCPNEDPCFVHVNCARTWRKSLEYRDFGNHPEICLIEMQALIDINWTLLSPYLRLVVATCGNSRHHVSRMQKISYRVILSVFAMMSVKGARNWFVAVPSPRPPQCAICHAMLDEYFAYTLVKHMLLIGG